MRKRSAAIILVTTTTAPMPTPPHLRALWCPLYRWHISSRDLLFSHEYSWQQEIERECSLLLGLTLLGMWAELDIALFRQSVSASESLIFLNFTQSNRMRRVTQDGWCIACQQIIFRHITEARQQLYLRK